MIATGNPPRLLEVKRRDGGRLAGYHWPGAGPSLLLIPGSWSDYRQFDAVRTHLAKNLDLALLESTSVPVLEVWGDRNRPRPSLRRMRIPERDNIQLRWVAGASHSLPLERPQEVAEAINRFVSSLEVS